MRIFSLMMILMGCRSESIKIDEPEVEQTVSDADGDGFTTEDDCDDYNETINPSATETCDGIDNNCDGQIDEDTLSLFYMDADEDLIKVLNKIDYFQVMLSYLDSILKTINNRTYQIKNSIEWQQFIRGYV